MPEARAGQAVTWTLSILPATSSLGCTGQGPGGSVVDRGIKNVEKQDIIVGLLWLQEGAETI